MLRSVVGVVGCGWTWNIGIIQRLAILYNDIVGVRFPAVHLKLKVNKFLVETFNLLITVLTTVK